MQLHKILSGTSFVCGLIGIAGLAGAIETGTGYLQSIIALLICGLFALWAACESGSLTKFLSERKNNKKLGIPTLQK